MAKSNARVNAAYRALRKRLGLTPAQAAGAVGALTGESGPNLDPNARNRSSGALGIGQWLGGRARGVRAGDFEGQLKHLVGELSGSERGALNALRGAKSAEQAAEIFTRKFERPSPGEIASSLGARQAAARRIQAALAGVDLGSLPTGSAAGGRRGATTRSIPGATATSATWTGDVQAARDEPSMKAAIIQTLGQRRGLGDFRHSRLKQAQYLLETGQAVERVPVQATGKMDLTRTRIPGMTVKIPGAPGRTQGPSRAGGSTAASLGKISIFNANPERLNHMVTDFARRLAGQAHTELKLDSGATHSKFTVNGNVSEHFTGHATDIPATGARLTRLGQEALITAGWDPKRARATKGGLFNVVHNGVRYQIIFNTMEGGNHYTHLHVGAKKL